MSMFQKAKQKVAKPDEATSPRGHNDDGAAPAAATQAPPTPLSAPPEKPIEKPAKSEPAPQPAEVAPKKEKKKDKEHKEAAASATGDDSLKEEAKKLKEQREKDEKKKKDEEKKSKSASKPSVDDAQFGESVDAERDALESAAEAPGASSNVASEDYELFPPAVYAAYGKLQEHARDLNTSIAAPEIVLVGPVNSGKSTLLDGFIGERLNPTRATLRPLHITLVNNADCVEPRVTIKRDATIAEYDHDTPVAAGHLAAEIDDRNREFSETPIYVLYESNKVLNATFIDTPGIDEKNAKTEALALSYMQGDRQIVACETAKEFSKVTMLEIVKRCDPDLSRSVFVFTKFNQLLRQFSDARALNRYLSQSYPDVPTYFVSMPSSRIACESRDDLQRRVRQALRRDMALLEQLQHDKRHEKSFGLCAVRRRVLRGVWRAYQDSVPRVLKQLRARAASAEVDLRQVQAQLQSLDAAKLRAVASHYVVAFLHAVERLLEGTADANPTATGQTLLEERRDYGHDEWLDGANRPIRFDPNEWKVPYADAKLYGGQQFERALAEFRAVVTHADLGNVSFDEIASSAGLNRLNNVPNFGWAASDLASAKTRDTFLPLIDQLTARVVYIVKRLATLADVLVEASRSASRAAATPLSFGTTASTGAPSGDDAFAPEHFPYFTHHVKDLYFKFVEAAAARCKEKCLDEFYSTRTIYWHLSEYGDRKVPTDRAAPEEAKKAVVELATDVFNELRERIVRNVLLKFYNFFLVPLQVELWSDLQGKITTLSDKSLEQLFHLSEMQSRLQQLEKRATVTLQRLSTQDEKFRAAASAFAHPAMAGGAGADAKADE